MQRINFKNNPSKLGLLETELESGESLLWAGEPDPVRSARQAIPLFIFGVAWSSFSVNFICKWPHPDLAFWLFQIPFILVGLFTLLSPYITYRTAVQTAYGITNRRILIVSGSKTRKVDSYDSTRLGGLTRVERPDGSGDLAFAQESYRDSDGDRQTRKIEFLGIPAVRDVENLIRHTLLAEDKSKES